MLGRLVLLGMVPVLVGCVADAPPPGILANTDVALLQACEEARSQNNYAAMISRCGEVETLPGILPERRRRAQIAVGEGLYRSDLAVEALAKFDALVQNPMVEDGNAARRLNALAENWRIFALRQVGRWMEIPPLADQFAARYGNEPDPYFHRLISEGMVEKGAAFGRGNRHELAIAAYDWVIERYSDNDDTGVREHLARAHGNKANQLLQLKRFDAAIAAANDCITRFQQEGAPTLREIVARAKRVRGLAQQKSGDESGALVSFTEVVDQYRQDRREKTRQQVGWAEINRAHLLHNKGQDRDARPLVIAALSRLENETDSTLREIRRDLQDLLNQIEKP